MYTWTVVDQSTCHRNEEVSLTVSSSSASLQLLFNSERWCLLEKWLGMIEQETLNKTNYCPHYKVDDLINHPYLLTEFSCCFLFNCTSVWPKRTILKRSNKIFIGNTFPNCNICFLIGPFSSYTFSMVANYLQIKSKSLSLLRLSQQACYTNTTSLLHEPQSLWLRSWALEVDRDG